MLAKIKKLFRNPYILFALAALLLWFGSFIKEPMATQHKFLISSEKMTQPPFDRAVILMLRHDRFGAYGVIVNKPPTGGPVDKEKTAYLYSNDKMLETGDIIAPLSIGYSDDPKAADEIADKRPAWSLTLNGYAGWGIKQLDFEIMDGRWRVIDYDIHLLTRIAPEKMWDEAQKRPDAKID